MAGDALAILEAAYAETADADAWLRGALEALTPHLDQGGGLMAHRFAHEADSMRFWPLATVKGDPQYVADLQSLLDGDWFTPRRAALLRTAYPCSPTATTLRRLLGEDWIGVCASAMEGVSPAISRKLLSFADGVGIVAGDPSGHGCLFFSVGSESVRMSTRRLAHWQRIAAHLVTGYRLARRSCRDGEAILAPAGKLLHRDEGITSEECGALSEATQAIDKARGKLRRVDPDRALSLWKGLVSGRWSLVDHFDHDSKRFVVAKRNTLGLRVWHTLTEREHQAVAFVAQGQTLKIIAYQLGVSTATVAADLARAQSKLRVSSRLELAAVYRAHHQAPGDP
jgi:DNA-binding CsgD family transcriptional regulator